MSKMKERTKVRLWVAIIILVMLVLGAIDYPARVDAGIDWVNGKLKTTFPRVYNLPFHLGLDLQGGTHLVYEADVSKIPSGDIASSVDGVRDVIERRVNSLGVAEPTIQINQSSDHWRVIVELAGVNDVKDAIKLIGETPLLEFKEQNNEPARDLTAEEKKQMDDYNAAAEKTAKDLLTEAKTTADFAQLVKDKSEDQNTKANGGDLGYLKKDDPGYPEIYDAIAKLKPVSGAIIDKVITDDNGYNIVKITDVKKDEQVKASHILICYEDAPAYSADMTCDSGLNKEKALERINGLKAQATAENFAQLAKDNSTEPAASSTSGELGWFSRGTMIQAFENAAFALGKGQISDVVETDFGYHLIYKEDEKVAPEDLYKVERLLVATKSAADILPSTDPWKNTGLSGKQLVKSLVTFDNYTNEPQVNLEFNDEGKELFGQITERNVGKPVAIYLDNEPISVPTVNEAIKDGKAVITGRFDITEAKTLSQRLNAGALPVPINLISQQTIGASLGSESLAKSLLAGLIGLILVGIFMIGYYRLPGVLSVLSLLFYTIILLFIFKLIPITLTLSGIAGFVLSLGMAVDANVLIFERMKEELKLGKPLGSAIDEGFKRAWPSIRDGNASTLITCLFLALFGTSSIKGFAITLTAGVLMSMLSAIVVTRVWLKLTVGWKKTASRFFFLGMKKEAEKESQK
jgi:protein-export membrane protein SecD